MLAGLVIAVQCLLGGAFNLAAGNLFFLGNSLAGFLLLPVTLPIVRLTRRPGPGATWLGLIGFLLIAIGMFVDGGLFSPTILFLLLLPAMTHTLGGWKHGAISMVLVSLGLLGMFLFQAELAPFIRPPAPETQAWFVVQDYVFAATILLLIFWFRDRSLKQAHATAQEEIQARLTAEAESRAKSQVLASMSHEIRTPLNGVLGSVELMRGMPMSAEMRAHVEAISSSGDLLHGILNDILDSAKAEAGLIELVNESVSPSAMADSVVQLLQGRADQKGLTLRSELADGLPAGLEGDRQRIKQILLNLVGNGIKFTSAGGVTLRQRFEAGHWILEVQDSGVGIADAARERIFQPFVQAERDTSYRHGGTGLGLSISRQLTELMQGTLTLESEPGVGTTFTLRIPSRPLAAPDRAEVAEPGSHSPLQVLVVEDNAVNQTVIRQLLLRDGHRVTLAEDGLVALERCAAQAFDLVLMDLNMPRMDGLEATRALRAIPGLEGMPIVGLSASAMDADRQRAISAGMNDFLAKPVKVPQLRATLQAYAPAPQQTPPREAAN